MRRLQIIESATKVFGDDGFHKGTMEDIACGAGIGKGTVYEYFKSKKSLFNHVIIYLLESYYVVIKEVVDRDISTREKVEELTCKSQIFMRDNSSIIKETIIQSRNLAIEFDESIKELHKKIMDCMFQIVEDGKKSKEINPELNKGTVSFIILNTMIGLTNMADNFGDQYPLDSKYVVDVIFTGIE